MKPPSFEIGEPVTIIGQQGRNKYPPSNAEALLLKKLHSLDKTARLHMGIQI